MFALRCWVCSAVGGVLLAGCGQREVAEEAGAKPAEEAVPSGLSDGELASWFMAKRRYAQALPLVERVVEERRESGGIPLGEALLSLGITRDALGLSNSALPSLAEAWELLQEGRSPAETLGACADAIGLACHGAGLYEDAEAAFLEAIEYREAASPDQPEPWVFASRTHLGRLYMTMARYEESEALLSAALASAPDDAAVATRARHLGAYHHTLGAYGRATELFERALAAVRRVFGEDGHQAAAVIGDLGLAQLRAGEIGAARASLERSRAIIQALPSPAPDLVATSADNLATFYLFVGEADKAVPLLADPDDAVGFNNLGSALQMVGEFDNAGECFERARSLADAELDEHHPLRVQVLQNLACVRWDLGDKDGALAAAREAGVVAVELLEHLLEFGNEAQRLEFRRGSDPLSLLCSFGAPPGEIAAMLRRTKGVVLDSLLGAGEGGDATRTLPDGGSFVDYAVYQRYLGRGGWEQRYGAVVRAADGVSWVELGSAKRLRTLLADLRAHVTAASGAGGDAVLSCAAVLAGLHEFCIAPLGDIGARPVIATDGDLKFVPFAALRGAGGGFLCEQLDELRLVPSGRAPVGESSAGAGWFQCAVADYSAGPPGSVTGQLRERLASLGSLPGVDRERSALAEVADFKALSGAKSALVAKLSTSPAPRVLHFSCHGLFLGDGERPMSRSGLVLAGREMLTAGEIAELQLSGTELVVLSACDTGLGTNVPGEGVLGLQRGFQLAGAEHILMTLWAVGDEFLPAFMANFYVRLKAGASPSAALWQTQRQQLRIVAESGDLARAVWIGGGFSMLAR